MEDLTKIKYKRHEYNVRPQKCENNLLVFTYDIPHFGACGIFPPLHIANQIFSNGGHKGGMSPGATWKPFKITMEEYDKFIELVKSTPISDIQPHARYAWLPYKFDSDFDHIKDHKSWMFAACEKHRDSWHKEFEKLEEQQ
jgi:hypothetical protein